MQARFLLGIAGLRANVKASKSIALVTGGLEALFYERVQLQTGRLPARSNLLYAEMGLSQLDNTTIQAFASAAEAHVVAGNADAATAITLDAAALLPDVMFEHNRRASSVSDFRATPLFLYRESARGN